MYHPISTHDLLLEDMSITMPIVRPQPRAFSSLLQQPCPMTSERLERLQLEEQQLMRRARLLQQQLLAARKREACLALPASSRLVFHELQQHAPHLPIVRDETLSSSTTMLPIVPTLDSSSSQSVVSGGAPKKRTALHSTEEESSSNMSAKKSRKDELPSNGRPRHVPDIDLEDSINAVPKGNEAVALASDKDVLCGRGWRTNIHMGNSIFRELIDRHRQDYLDGLRRDKIEVSIAVVRAIRKDGGRFLKKDNGVWFEIGDGDALEKTRRAFRQRAPKRRKIMFEAGRRADEEHQAHVLIDRRRELLKAAPGGSSGRLQHQAYVLIDRRRELLKAASGGSSGRLLYR